MILVADSGSTKTDWVVRTLSPSVEGSAQLWFHTQGINPIHQDDRQILSVLQDELLPQLVSINQLSAIEFYGSGVRPDQEKRMERLLREAFQSLISKTQTSISAHSDLLGAARALCGDSEGLACILGTGVNSCLYDGKRIVANTPPLGYILGDEGSGAVLGKLFLNSLYKGCLGNEIKSDFETEMQMTLAEVINRVYRQPLPNRWLASLSPFIHSHLCNPDVEALVIGNFSHFIARNIEPYHRRDLPLQAVGSIAFFYKEQLCLAAKEAGFAVGKILRSPLDPSGIC